MNETTKIIKIVCVILALIWLCWIILASGTSTKISEAQTTVKELIQLKEQKEECRNSLSYLETIEDYKGFLHCGENDERIKELKNILQETLINEYEKVDNIIMQKQLEQIAQVETWRVEQFTAFMMSE